MFYHSKIFTTHSYPPYKFFLPPKVIYLPPTAFDSPTQSFLPYMIFSPPLSFLSPKTLYLCFQWFFPHFYLCFQWFLPPFLPLFPMVFTPIFTSVSNGFYPHFYLCFQWFFPPFLPLFPMVFPPFLPLFPIVFTPIFTSVSTDVSIVMLLALTIERYISVCFPTKPNNVAQATQRSCTVAILLPILSFVVHSPYLFLATVLQCKLGSGECYQNALITLCLPGLRVCPLSSIYWLVN